MQHHLGTTVATYCLLALAGGFSFVLPEQLGVPSSSGHAGPLPLVVTLAGTQCHWQPSKNAGSQGPLDGFLASPSSATSFRGIELPLQCGIDGVYEWRLDAPVSHAGLEQVNHVGPTSMAAANPAGSGFVIHIVDAVVQHQPVRHGFISLEHCHQAWLMVDGVVVAGMGETGSPVVRANLNDLGLVEGSVHTLRLIMAQSAAPGEVAAVVRTNAVFVEGDGLPTHRPAQTAQPAQFSS